VRREANAKLQCVEQAEEDREFRAPRQQAVDESSPRSDDLSGPSGAGLVAGSDVADGQVTCTTNAFRIGGMVSGLTGAGLVLNNGGDDLAITGTGTFAFLTPVAGGAIYNVMVKTQPSGQPCAITGGTGHGGRE
jgi:hypothetical protein